MKRQAEIELDQFHNQQPLTPIKREPSPAPHNNNRHSPRVQSSPPSSPAASPAVSTGSNDLHDVSQILRAVNGHEQLFNGFNGQTPPHLFNGHAAAKQEA